MNDSATLRLTEDAVERTLEAVEQLCERYQIGALDGFLASCRAFAAEKVLNVAVFGRFKAGKSSFLNHILGRPLLPVGVVPVTSAVTEIEYGPRDRAEVRFLDGRREAIPLERIADFISETRNPHNQKQVHSVRVELPQMERYRGIRFVDTPGLESVFEHNTDASLAWLPNVGLALVAVGVDPPLTQHDIELLRNISRYTPNISLLLTKVDTLDETERAEVIAFVERQLQTYWNGALPVYPYSVRPGFEHLRARLDESLLAQVRARAGEEHSAILRHKLASLAGECAEFLNLALKSAEVADSERDQLRRKILGERESLEDTRLALRLLVRHAAAGSRSAFEALLAQEEFPIRTRLLAALERQFPAWTASLSGAIDRFEAWLEADLTREMAALSAKYRDDFTEPVRRVGRQLSQALQDFRNRLSQRTLETLGVPLRTTEMALEVESPRAPDVRVGKVFDHNWELVSFLVPMRLVQGAVKKHFMRRTADAVVVNLSRLAAQWEEIVNGQLLALEREALRRLDGLVSTIEKLVAAAAAEAPRIRADLERLDAIRAELAGVNGSPR